jgi:hypothetical protein
MGLESNKSVQCEPEPSQSQAGQPRRGRSVSNCRRWIYATVTDLQRQSRVSLQRQWPRGHIPRPAGLGEAGRPHLAAFEALIGVKDKHNRLTCVQLTLRPVPTLE